MRFLPVAAICIVAQACMASTAAVQPDDAAVHAPPSNPVSIWVGMSLLAVTLAALALHQYILRRRSERHQHALLQAARIQAVAQLTDRVVHDFRNLLLAVGANVELVSQDLPDDHAAQANLALVREAVCQGNDLTESLMTRNTPLSTSIARESLLARPAAPRADRAMPAESRGAALVIESDPLLRAMISSMLRQLGYAASGIAAIEDLAAVLDSIDGPTLVLFSQPGEPVQLQRTLESLSFHPQVRQLLMITDQRSSAVSAENLVIVRKPFRIDDLANALAPVAV